MFNPIKIVLTSGRWKLLIDLCIPKMFLQEKSSEADSEIFFQRWLYHQIWFSKKDFHIKGLVVPLSTCVIVTLFWPNFPKKTRKGRTIPNSGSTNDFAIVFLLLIDIHVHFQLPTFDEYLHLIKK
jgi:hypothetical protein